MNTDARTLLADAASALAFFTRLPVPAAHASRPLARAFWAAPVAGLAVGAIGGLAFWAADVLGMPGGVAATLALTATVLVTGGLHEDGLADTADGFGGGRDREHRLEIMRDSRIGSYGALALGLSLLLRWSALSALAEPASAACVLLATHAASRALLPAYLRWSPPARSSGLAASAGTPSADTALVALVLGATALLLLGAAGFVGSALALAVVFFAFRRLSLRHIGGHTGDTAGALQQLGEAAVLVAASASLL